VPRLEETYQHLLLCYLYSPPNRSRQHTAMIFCATCCGLQRGGLFFRYLPIQLDKHFGLYIQNSTCKVKVTSLPPSNEPYISNTFSASTIPSEETGFSIPQRSNLPKNKNKSVPERKSLKLQKSGVACHYNLLPKLPSNHHNEAPTIPSTPLLPKSLPTNFPQSPTSQPTFQSSRSPPTSSHQVPNPQSFPNDHRSSTDTPQILHQCSLSNQKATDLSLSSTEKMKSPLAASPPSMDKSPLQHSNHTTPPTSNESTPKCRQCKSPPTTYEGPPKLHTSHTATPTFNFLQTLVQNALQNRTCW